MEIENNFLLNNIFSHSKTVEVLPAILKDMLINRLNIRACAENITEINIFNYHANNFAFNIYLSSADILCALMHGFNNTA